MDEPDEPPAQGRQARRGWTTVVVVAFVLAWVPATLVGLQVAAAGAFWDAAGAAALVAWPVLVWPVREFLARVVPERTPTGSVTAPLRAAPSPAPEPTEPPPVRPLPVHQQAADQPVVQPVDEVPVRDERPSAPDVTAGFRPDPSTLARHDRSTAIAYPSAAAAVAFVGAVLLAVLDESEDRIYLFVGALVVLLGVGLALAGATWLLTRWQSRRHLARFELDLEGTVLRAVRPAFLRKDSVDLAEVRALVLTEGETGWMLNNSSRQETTLRVVHRDRWAPDVLLASGHVPRAVQGPLGEFVRDLAARHDLSVVVHRQQPPRREFL